MIEIHGTASMKGTPELTIQNPNYSLRPWPLRVVTERAMPMEEDIIRDILENMDELSGW